MITKFYPLADRPSQAELKALGFKRSNSGSTFPWGNPFQPGRPGLAAVKIREKRAPKAGEWFLSGAIPEAYKAHNDLDTEFHILRLARIETTTTSRESEAPR